MARSGVSTEERARGGPFSCCTLDWISVARGSMSACCRRARRGRRGVRRRRPMPTACAGWSRRVGAAGEPVRGVIESMTGARFVHDTLEQLGWEVLIADAQKVKGLAPLACKTDKIDARVLAVLSHRDLVPAIWLPDPRVRREREQARFRLHLVKHKLDAQAPHPRDADHLRAPVPGHRPVRRRRPRAARPPRDPAAVARDGRRQPVADRRPRAPRSTQINRELRAGGADHPYVPLLLTVPGIGWVLAFTIAAEIGDITRFASRPRSSCGYTGLCPRVRQSGDKDRRGPLTKQGPKYLRWAMLEATMHALRHPAYRERYQRNKRRLGKPARRQGRPDRHRPKAHRSDLAHAHPQPALRTHSRCGRRRFSSGRLTALLELRPRSRPPMSPGPPTEEAIER